jgi:hypothetical protein
MTECVNDHGMYATNPELYVLCLLAVSVFSLGAVLLYDYIAYKIDRWAESQKGDFKTEEDTLVKRTRDWLYKNF